MICSLKDKIFRNPVPGIITDVCPEIYLKVFTEINKQKIVEYHFFNTESNLGFMQSHNPAKDSTRSRTESYLLRQIQL